MAWTYFTSYLNGTRPITKPERDELYDQLAAKLARACPVRFGLNATNQTAIKSSLLLTDLTSVTVLAGGSTGTNSLYVTLTAVIYDQFTNTVAAKDSALSDEGITSTDLSDMLSGKVDSYHLWNFYKRWIDYLTLSALPASIVFRSASASKTKCGFSEFVPSTPPKIYRNATNSGSVSETSYNTNPPGSPSNETVTVGTWSGGSVYATPGCAAPSSSGSEYVTSTAYGVTTVLTGQSGLLNETEITGGGAKGCGILPPIAPGACSITYTATTATFDNNWSDPGGFSAGSFVLTLSDEYTTLQLLNDTYSSIPAFSGAFTAGAVTAVSDLTADELTSSRRSFQYKFILPDLTGCASYRLDWNEIYTYPGGFPPGYAARSYVWDGIATETPVYTVASPGDPATIISVSAAVASS